MRHGGTPVEQVNTTHGLSVRAIHTLQCKTGCQVWKTRSFGIRCRLLGGNVVCPSVDVGAVALQLRAVDHVDVKTGAKNDCIKVLGAAIRQGDTHAVLHGLYIFPATSQLQAERGKRIAAAHGFPWWRYLFVKNIRIKTPFALIVQLRIATQEARERCCFALVDLRHQLASRKLPHGGACFQCASRIVKGRGTGTQHRNGFALHGCKVNLIHGVKDAALGQWVLHGQIGEVGPARCTAAIAA